MIVNRLPYLMDQKKVSIRQLSRSTGITYTTIRAVYHSERRSVQLEVLDAICQALDIQPGDIYIRAPEDQSDPDVLAAVISTEPVEVRPLEGETQTTDKMLPELGEERKNDDWKSW